ncbi:hypothetical protein CHISP_2270 [Chitinispirillum alkaliphilum]|nr:hypothetical protein CHISP_2270 [Chitinispirillum alkaliphilum]
MFKKVTLFLLSTTILLYADWNIPQGWGDFRIGLVSDGDLVTNERLRAATQDLGIQIAYRYRYINEGVNPAGNACQWVFPKPGNGVNYSKVSYEQTGTQASYVIYVLQEEGGRTKLLENISDPIKMRQFLHTLRIVGENAAGYGATIIVEPDTWGYLLQERFGSEVDHSKEWDPHKIPAVINNIPDSTFIDTTIIPNWLTGIHDTIIDTVHLDHSYLSDLPNNMAGLGRAMIRTLRRYAPDSYIGFLASHWSVNLNLDNNGWSDRGLVWSTPELRDTSAKINIEFFRKFYWGADEYSPKQPGDDPDFIGMEKNGWCAGLWQSFDGRTNWFWDDTHMENYLQWVKQIAQGLDLPVVGWQISIGNMGNNNTANSEQMANSYQDTFFPYFFSNVDKFLDAGFIGFLVGKGLPQATDYTLPSENIGEGGWFFNQLIEFDKGRPYLSPTSSITTPSNKTPETSRYHISGNADMLKLSAPGISPVEIKIFDLNGRLLRVQNHTFGETTISVPLEGLSSGVKVLRIKDEQRVEHHRFYR